MAIIKSDTFTTATTQQISVYDTDYTITSGAGYLVDADGDYLSIATVGINGVAYYNVASDYTEMQIVSDVYVQYSDNAWVGLIGRYTYDGSNLHTGYLFTVNTNTDQCRLLYLNGEGINPETVGTAITAETALPSALSNQVWFELKLVIEGTTITGYVNGVQAITGTHASIATGSMAFSATQENARYDNLVFETIDSSSGIPIIAHTIYSRMRNG